MSIDSIGKNWKTTLLGLATIVFAITGLAVGKLDWTQASALIAGGLGLIVAKDADKTGA